MHESLDTTLFGQPRPPGIANWKVAAIWLGIGVALTWIGPRIYEPTYLGTWEHDATRLTHYRRQWFGPTIATTLTAKPIPFEKTVVWMAKDKNGAWYEFFRDID